MCALKMIKLWLGCCLLRALRLLGVFDVMTSVLLGMVRRTIQQQCDSCRGFAHGGRWNVALPCPEHVPHRRIQRLIQCRRGH